MKRKQTLSGDWPCPENSKANMPVCLLTKPLLRGTSMFWNSDCLCRQSGAPKRSKCQSVLEMMLYPVREF